MVRCTNNEERMLCDIATKCALYVISEFTRQGRRKKQRKTRKQTKGANEEKKIYDYLYSLYSLYSLNLHNNHLKSIYNYNNYNKLGRMNSTRKIEVSLAELAQIVLEASKSRVQTDHPQEIEALTAKNAALTAELEALTAELEARRTTIEALEADNSSLERKIRSLYADLEKAKALPESNVRVTISEIHEPTVNPLGLWRQMVLGTNQKGEDINVSFNLGPSQYKDDNALNDEQHTGWTISATFYKGRFQTDHRTAYLRPPTPTLGDHLRHQQLSDQDNGFLPLPDPENEDDLYKGDEH